MTKKKKKLRLNSESIRVLNDEALEQVGGGYRMYTQAGHQCDTTVCDPTGYSNTGHGSSGGHWGGHSGGHSGGHGGWWF